MKHLVFILGFLLLTLGCVSNKLGKSPLKIVVIGSSTAYGTGPKSIDSAWVNVLREYERNIDIKNEVINIAKGGYTTYHLLPNDFHVISGRPKPDTLRNITKALSFNPDIVIINLPSNDAAYSYGVEEQMTNFSIMSDKCIDIDKKIKVLICSAQPRNFNSDKIEQQIKLNTELYKKHKSNIVDFWSELSNQDGTINPKYSSGDGVHLNGKGHKILFERIVKKLHSLGL